MGNWGLGIGEVHGLIDCIEIYEPSVTVTGIIVLR